jgi:transporter family-2 protein
MTIDATQRVKAHPMAFFAAFGTGGLLSLMVHFNGQLAYYGNAMFSAWVAHGTGTIAAVILLALLYRHRNPMAEGLPSAPAWAYLGGVSGAATVILASTAVNSPVGLSGTLALSLAGQMIFSLAADTWGFFGLPKRRPDTRDLVTLCLILAGTALIILAREDAA